jgi:protein-disulfide isomerase
VSSHAPTKRQLREQRRAERLAAEQAAVAKAARRRRGWILAGAAGLAAVAVVLAVVLTSSSDKSAGGGGGASIASAPSIFAGIPENHGVLGDPSAPVTVTEYADLQCPVCAEASASTLPAMVRDYVKTGKVKLEMRTLHFLGPDSVRAAEVAAGAERQGRLWSFVETFYANQGEENSGYVTDAFLRQVSAASGVNASTAMGQTKTAFAQDRLSRANADASKLGINSTPTFTVARGDGPARVVGSGVLSEQILGAAIDKELAR